MIRGQSGLTFASTGHSLLRAVPAGPDSGSRRPGDLIPPPRNLLRHYVFARAEPLEPGLALPTDPLAGGIPEQAEHGRVQDYGEFAGQLLGVLVGPGTHGTTCPWRQTVRTAR